MTGEDEPRRVLSDSLWASWSANTELVDDGCVRWDDAGALGPDVRAIRLMTWTSDDQPPLPAGLGALTGVVALELPSYVLKSATPADLPPAVETLHVEGERSVTVSRGLVMPTLRVLRAGGGPLRFSPEQFPALDDLTIRLDRKSAKAPEIVRGCGGLRSLGVTATYDPEALPTFAALPPETLGVAGGNVADLSFVRAFGGLKALNVANLPRLTTLAPLADARDLERVRIAHCQHIADLTPLLSLPALRELELVRCGDVEAIRPELESRGLDRLMLI